MRPPSAFARDLHVAVDNAHVVRLGRHDHRKRRRHPRPNLERPAVQRTFDLVADDLPVRQRRFFMGADVAERVSTRRRD